MNLLKAEMLCCSLFVCWVLRAMLVLAWMISKFLGCCLFPPKVAVHALFQMFRPPAFRGPLWTCLPMFISAHRVSQPSSLKYDCITWDTLSLPKDVIETAWHHTRHRHYPFTFPERLWVLRWFSNLRPVRSKFLVQFVKVTLLTSSQVLLMTLVWSWPTTLTS